MKRRIKKVLRTAIWSAILFLLAGTVRIAVPSPVLAPSLDAQVLGDQTAADNAATFSLANLPAIDDKTVSAKSYLVYDQNTGKPLAMRLANSAVPIASLTKLMTGYLVNKYGAMEDVYTIPSGAVFNINPVLGLKTGDQIKIADLFNSMIVGSANDAALALGYYLENKQRSSIQNLMNSEAVKLNMSNTHFSNPLGFDSETNYSTAQDLKILVQATAKYPSFANLDRMQSYSFTTQNNQTFKVDSTNKLLAEDSEIHAVKTGFTDEAGGAMITSIHHSASNFIIIVLGSTNREADTKLIKDQIIKNFYSKN